MCRWVTRLYQAPLKRGTSRDESWSDMAVSKWRLDAASHGGEASRPVNSGRFAASPGGAHLFGGWLNSFAMLPVLWFGAKNVMTVCREPQRSQRKRSFTLISGKPSPRCLRSFSSERRAECLHLRQ